MPASLADGGRLIKTHEPYRRQYRRAVYLVRDPRAVVVSEHGFIRWHRLDDQELVAFVPNFVGGKVNGFGSWQSHVTSWIGSELATGGGLLVVRYEDLRQDPETWFRRIVDFLALRVDDDTLKAILRHQSIRSMREREDRARNALYRHTDRRFRFVNEGSVAGWQDTLPLESIALIERSWGELLDRLGYPRTFGARCGPRARSDRRQRLFETLAE